jgi:hypothetical protein
MKRVVFGVLFSLIAIFPNLVLGEAINPNFSNLLNQYKKAIKIDDADTGYARLAGLLKKLEAMKDGHENKGIAPKKVSDLKYVILVEMGLKKIQERKESSSNQANLASDALDCLYKAALLEPDRPEAHICLGWLRHEVEGAPEGQWEINKAQAACKNKPNIDLVLVEGRLAEMTGNYPAAAKCYAKAMQPQSKWSLEPYVFDQFRKSVLSAWDCGSKLYWVPSVFDTYYGHKEAVVSAMQNVREKIVNLPLGVGVDTAYVYRVLLYYKLREKASDYPYLQKYDKPYKLKKLFALSMPMQDKQNKRNVQKKRRLCTAFIAASFDMNETKQAQLQKEWDRIESEVKEKFGKEKDPKAKARGLLTWLKQNVLRDYDISQGYTAEDVLQKHKYLCLTGAVTYTLLAKSLGLDSKGVVIPGHALSCVKFPDSYALVETTACDPDKHKCDDNPCHKFAELPVAASQTKHKEFLKLIVHQGGGTIPAANDQAFLNMLELGYCRHNTNRGKSAKGGFFVKAHGQVCTPSKLVAFQYSNMCVAETNVLFEKHRDEVINTVKHLKPKLSEQEVLEIVNDEWPKYAFLKKHGKLYWEVFVKLVLRDEIFRHDYVNQLKKELPVAFRGYEVDPGISSRIITQIHADLSKLFIIKHALLAGMVEKARLRGKNHKNAARLLGQHPQNSAKKVQPDKSSVTDPAEADRMNQEIGSFANAVMQALGKLDRKKGLTILTSPFKPIYSLILESAVLTDNSDLSERIISEVVSGATIKPNDI